MLKHFRGSLIFTAVALAVGYVLDGWDGAWIVLVLAALEGSLSFDNAVVNAKILSGMDPVWRRRFMVWGMLIAVVFMRLAFPLLLVGVAARMGPLAVLDMAIFQPHDYAKAVTSAHDQIAAFGGAFLSLVFFKFFIDINKSTHWLGPIERILTRLGKLNAIEIVLALGLLLIAAQGFDDHAWARFIAAGIAGIAAFVLVDGLGDLLGEDGSAAFAAKQGLSGFIYLEVLDASFSFDGVIGAFALSHNLFVIALGLGVGAMLVRAFTLMLVDKSTLNAYRYLEHGAFWAIGALAIIMLASASREIPEVLTGGIGIALIALSLGTSVWQERRESRR